MAKLSQKLKKWLLFSWNAEYVELNKANIYQPQSALQTTMARAESRANVRFSILYS